jgi:hypothetical protein
MSPISAPEPCPHMKTVISDGETYYFCIIYDKRPEQCKNHTFDANKCPIGHDVLNIQSADEANRRINKGYAIIKKGLMPLERGEMWW